MNVIKFSKFMKALKDQKGFSLMEILIALTLLALVGTFAATKLFDMFEEGRISSVQIQMQTLEGRLQDFRRHCGFYPTTDQGLDALISKPGGRECKKYRPSGYLDDEKLLIDPWDEELVYTSDGRKFTIMSYGADKQEGGEGYYADLYHPPKKSRGAK